MSKPSCFIIMPLSTPSQYVDTYKGDTQHFIHVLEHLFQPAIQAAGMNPIPPISKGSPVIHGDIIKNLETADLVLCDMSILNPNVFFELGIRTALNKSVAMIRDNVTERVPFDTTIINYHEYDCGLDPWVLPGEVERLTNHLKDCMGNGASNSLWGYFSMTQQAEVPSDAPEVEKQLGYLIKQVEGLSEQINVAPSVSKNPEVTNVLSRIRLAEDVGQVRRTHILLKLKKVLFKHNQTIEDFVYHFGKDSSIVIVAKQSPSDQLQRDLLDCCRSNGYEAVIQTKSA